MSVRFAPGTAPGARPAPAIVDRVQELIEAKIGNFQTQIDELKRQNADLLNELEEAEQRESLKQRELKKKNVLLKKLGQGKDVLKLEQELKEQKAATVRAEENAHVLEGELAVATKKIMEMSARVLQLEKSEGSLKAFLESATFGIDGASSTPARSKSRSRSRPKSRPRSRGPQADSPEGGQSATTPRRLSVSSRASSRAESLESPVGPGSYDIYDRDTIGAKYGKSVKKYVPPKTLGDRRSWVPKTEGADKQYDSSAHRPLKASGHGNTVMMSKQKRFVDIAHTDAGRSPGVGSYDIYDKDTMGSRQMGVGQFKTETCDRTEWRNPTNREAWAYMEKPPPKAKVGKPSDR